MVVKHLSYPTPELPQSYALMQDSLTIRQKVFPISDKLLSASRAVDSADSCGAAGRVSYPQTAQPQLVFDKKVLLMAHDD